MGKASTKPARAAQRVVGGDTLIPTTPRVCEGCEAKLQPWQKRRECDRCGRMVCRTCIKASNGQGTICRECGK